MLRRLPGSQTVSRNTGIIGALSSTISFHAGRCINIRASSALLDGIQRPQFKYYSKDATRVTIGEKLNLENERYEFLFEPKGRLFDIPPIQLPKANIWREYLEDKNYVGFAICLLDALEQDPNIVSRLVTSGEFSKEEYSIFINKLITFEGVDSAFKRAMPDLLYTEVIYKFFEVYSYIDNGSLSDTSLNVLELKDLNLFISTFIKKAQLGKAQGVLEYVLKRQGDIFTITDVDTLIHYLQLRCGALPQYWKVKKDNKWKNKSYLGSYSFITKLSNSYNANFEKSLMTITDEILTNKVWRNRHTSSLDSAIIYALSSFGQTKMIENYIKQMWGISMNSNIQLIAKSDYPPNFEVLTAIISSFIYNDKNMNRAMEYMDGFIKRHPDIDLDVLFWRRLLQWSIHTWNVREDRSGKICYRCWNLMRKWKMSHRKGNKYLGGLSYDQGIVKELYTLVKRTNNGPGSMIIIKEMMTQIYAKEGRNLKRGDFILLNKLQRLTISWFQKRGRNSSACSFIEEWSLNAKNRSELETISEKHRVKYQQVKQTKIIKKEFFNETFDDTEEEDMILGRLW